MVYFLSVPKGMVFERFWTEIGYVHSDESGEVSNVWKKLFLPLLKMLEE